MGGGGVLYFAGFGFKKPIDPYDDIMTMGLTMELPSIKQRDLELFLLAPISFGLPVGFCW